MYAAPSSVSLYKYYMIRNFGPTGILENGQIFERDFVTQLQCGSKGASPQTPAAAPPLDPDRVLRPRTLRGPPSTPLRAYRLLAQEEGTYFVLQCAM